jgi:hypothetical protein
MPRNRVDRRGVLTLASFSRLVLDFIIPSLLVAGTVVSFILLMIFGRVILGNAPGVLSRVVRLCVRIFVCRTRFDVGLFAFSIRGVSITL